MGAYSRWLRLEPAMLAKMTPMIRVSATAYATHVWPLSLRPPACARVGVQDRHQSFKNLTVLGKPSKSEPIIPSGSG